MPTQDNPQREKYKRQFATRLRVAMAAADVNGSELARRAGLHNTLVYNYVHAKTLPVADALARMCVVLKVDANDLLGIRRTDR